MQLRLIPLVSLALTIEALAGQVPGGAQRPDIAISHRDRFYTADQFSNTGSVIDPADNKIDASFARPDHRARMMRPSPTTLSIVATRITISAICSVEAAAMTSWLPWNWR